LKVSFTGGAESAARTDEVNPAKNSNAETKPLWMSRCAADDERNE
jgi:hypothetical protein